jgi:hypothetical protein
MPTSSWILVENIAKVKLYKPETVVAHLLCEVWVLYNLV